MANFFDGVITENLKQLFRDGVDTLLNPTNNVVSNCRIIYPATSYTSSTSPNMPGQTSSHHITGAPIPLHGFSHPAEADTVQPIQNTENISLIVIWNPRNWRTMTDKQMPPVGEPLKYVQVMGYANLLPKIMRAQEFILDTDHEPYNRYRYVRFDEPESLGLFSTRDYFLLFMQRAG